MTNAPNKSASDWDKRRCVCSTFMFLLQFQPQTQTRAVIYLSGVHHCSHSDGEGHAGNFGKVVPEETGVGYYGVLGQCLHSGPGHQTGAGLIKGDVPIWTDA